MPPPTPSSGQASLVSDHSDIVIDAGTFRLEGRSRAGHETWFRIREWSLGFDIGRCPDPMVSVPQIFITHTHLDHSVGIPFYAGQRHLQGMGGGRVYVPAEVLADVREVLAVHGRLTGGPFEHIEIIGLTEGDVVRVQKTHEVRVHRATHRVPANAYEVMEVRHRLRSGLEQESEEAIAARARAGEAVAEEYRIPLLFYTGDTDREIFERNEAMFRADVLLMECSFVLDGHQERAARYRHIHFDDLIDVAGRFENRLIVLSHFSRRYSSAQIVAEIRRRCPAVLRDRIRLLLAEPYQRLAGNGL
jgi:Metal-dependent hydrolases of the beta-lactamase superfamily III